MGRLTDAPTFRVSVEPLLTGHMSPLSLDLRPLVFEDTRLKVPRQFATFYSIVGKPESFDYQSNFAEAKHQWSEYGMENFNRLLYWRMILKDLEKNAHAAKNGKLLFPDIILLLNTGTWTLMLLPFILVVNWLAALSARPRRRWPRRVLA